MVELYLHSPISHHGIVLNYKIMYRHNFTFLRKQFFLLIIHNFSILLLLLCFVSCCKYVVNVSVPLRNT
jgi:hypothetical protein